jgi:tetratricopeptide (TPR) repeat protein
LLANFLRDCEGKHIRHAAEIPDLADLDDPNHRHPRRVMAAFAGLFGEGPELDLLHMMGLFDRPADAGCIAALRREPAVPGLTNELSKLDEAGWLRLLEQLRDLGLLAEASHHDPNELDAHPLVREHFGAELQNLQPGVWMAGHGRLYEHLKDLPEKHQPDTLAEMASLFQAIRHGCEAKRQQEVHDEVYSARINRGKKLYLVKKLGAFGADLGVMASFFDIVWEKPTSSLRETTQSSLLIGTAFNLAALGQLRSAMGLMLAGLKRLIKEENWKGAAINTYNLNELRLAMGDIADAVTLAKVGIEYADRTGEERERMISRANLANALLHSGNLQAAKTLFEEAETIQAKYQPSCPKLFAVWGYYYCDLLFYFERIETIQERAHYSLSLEATHTDLLSVALDNLSLGRAAFGQGQHADALVQFNQAVEGLRQSGQFQKLPRGLLARAALFCDAQKYDEARRDIDEAMRIATRCGMRLFECDAHLEYARLDLAEGNPDAARVHLKSTKALVSACGYHRRDGEIAEVEAALA